MKKILLLISLFLSSLSNAQEVYYNDVDLSAEGLSLKDKLATKTINEHTNLLSYTPGVWEALKVTDLNPTNNSEVLFLTCSLRPILQSSGMPSRVYEIEKILLKTKPCVKLYGEINP